MQRILYVSESRIAEADAELIISQIVAHAQIKNEELGLSGALIFTGQHFAQVLEGPIAAIYVLMAHIHSDARHANLIVVDKTPISKRLLADWQMAYQGPSQFVSRHVKRLLARIRRIELLNQDSVYRAVSAEATDIDAVRVLTIHGSKGLEFPAVHLPALATRYMPASRKGSRTPALTKYPQLNMAKDDHDAEEECLFFVGLSRARDHLSLTRAVRYTAQNSTASKFLESVSAVPATTRTVPSSVPQPIARKPVVVEQQTSYSASALETYIRCPARYRYEHLMGLRAGTDGAAFLDFHRCVRRTLAWIQAQRAEGVVTTAAAALAHLDTDWAERGPVGHGFEGYYRQAANRMVANGAAFIASEQGASVDGGLDVTIAGRIVTMDPDRLIDAGDVVRVQRIRTGRQTKGEGDKPIYGALRLAAQRRFPGRTITVGAYYPSDGETREFSDGKEEKAVKAFEGAINGIEAGQFPAKPDDSRFCPSCPCYFICGI